MSEGKLSKSDMKILAGFSEGEEGRIEKAMIWAVHYLDSLQSKGFVKGVHVLPTPEGSELVAALQRSGFTPTEQELHKCIGFLVARSNGESGLTGKKP